MKRPSKWSKAVKTALIDRNIKTYELANEIGYSKEYTSAIINGRVYSELATQRISDYLNIECNALENS